MRRLTHELAEIILDGLSMSLLFNAVAGLNALF